MPRLKIDSYITANDRERTSTVHMLEDLEAVLKTLNGRMNGAASFLDIGCGYGGLSVALAKHLNVKEVHGIDTDRHVLPEASSKGVQARHWPLGEFPLPYPAEHFDLVTSFGVLDTLPFFDDALREMFRILKPAGYAIVSLPNLASWHNRILLCCGYQPRDVEVSKQILAGVHPYYRRNDRPTGHIHTVTTSTFTELMEQFGFQTVCVRGARPLTTRKSWAINAVDRLLGKSPRLARRFFYVGQKPVATPPARS